MAKRPPKTSSKQRAQDKMKRTQEETTNTAVAEPEDDLLSGDTEEGSEVAVVSESGPGPHSETPSFGDAVVVESPTVESPIAISETSTTGEPKVKSAAQKKWREKNREKVQAYQKKWREKNKDKVKAIHTAYRKKNPEKVKGWQKASQSRRKEKQAAEKAATQPAESTQS